MNIQIFKAYRQFVTEQGLLFYYDGYLSQPIITAMGEALRGRLEAEEASSKAARKVFSTFIEMMQNVINYSDDAIAAGGSALSHGAVAVGRRQGHYFITCGNPVRCEHVERIRAKLAVIDAMSHDEIKQRYKEKLRQESEATSKGAGLGFLTVARDASAPIEYSFAPLAEAPDTLCFFYLKATI